MTTELILYANKEPFQGKKTKETNCIMLLLEEGEDYSLV